MPRWTVATPPIAVALLAAVSAMPPSSWLSGPCAAALIAAVLAAVHHAEVIAKRRIWCC